MPSLSPRTKNRLAALYFVGAAGLAAGVMLPTGPPGDSPAATPTAHSSEASDAPATPQARASAPARRAV
ncbi:MAG: hypothetical protein AAGF84_07190 [Planctomycetota bacterium]